MLFGISLDLVPIFEFDNYVYIFWYLNLDLNISNFSNKNSDKNSKNQCMYNYLLRYLLLCDLYSNTKMTIEYRSNSNFNFLWYNTISNQGKNYYFLYIDKYLNFDLFSRNIQYISKSIHYLLRNDIIPFPNLCIVD